MIDSFRRIGFALTLFVVSIEVTGSLLGESSEEPGRKKVMLWTWNSMKEDLSVEATDIFSSDADVIVSCQTEAVKGVREYTNDSEWLLVSHGEHTGLAGGNLNGQILSVFVRQPIDSEPYQATRSPEESWRVGGLSNGKRGSPGPSHCQDNDPSDIIIWEGWLVSGHLVDGWA